jgi:hypothetical protein
MTYRYLAQSIDQVVASERVATEATKNNHKQPNPADELKMKAFPKRK